MTPLPTSLKDYYQTFDKTIKKGISTFDDITIPEVLNKKFQSPSKNVSFYDANKNNKKILTSPKHLLNSSIRSYSPLKNNNNQNNTNSSIIFSPNKLNLTQDNTKFFDKTIENNSEFATTSSFFYTSDHQNPYNNKNLTNSLQDNHLDNTNNVRLHMAENKYRVAYNALKERDIVNIGNLEYNILQKDAIDAQKRWKEFIHNTNTQNYSILKGTQEYEDQLVKDLYGIESTDNNNNINSNSKIEKQIEDDVDEYMNHTHINDQHDHNVDFNILYARSIVIQQKWPWTCLVDLKTDKCFYRHEIQDYFQYDPPEEFLNNDINNIMEENEFENSNKINNDVFDLLEGVVEGNDGTVSIF